MRKVKLVLTGSVVLVATLLFVAMRPTPSFKKELWIAEANKRSKMLSYVMDKCSLRGRSNRGVVALLGAPDFENDTMLVYCIPTESSKGIFVLSLDSNGTVTKAVYDDSDWPEFYQK
ncbi:MAG: hypothetical protein HY986_00625 [Candidatus Melainabacteria bacterium]|nr:hypothetical protein [Candidatus Melainabacteria bacterium]